MYNTLTGITLAFLSVIFAGCGNGKSSQAKLSDTHINTPQTSDTDVIDEENTDSDVFAGCDQVKNLLEQWNAAISNHEPEKLSDIYADRVDCYLDVLSKQQCIEKKRNRLQAHPEYKQKITQPEIYYLDNDTNMSTLIAEFDKICMEKGETTDVRSLLYFTQVGTHWKITKETDIPTEIARARKSPAGTLKKGQQTFYYGYWQDTREVEDFAHDMVPYRFNLILNVDDKITGAYYLYSGMLRMMTYHLIVDGKIEDGILNITTVYNENEQYTLDDYPRDAHTEHWRYKIVDGKKLVGLDKDNGYLYGKTLVLEE